MNDAVRLRYLRIALVVIGVLSVVGIYPLMRIWSSGFAWHTGPYSDYTLMIVGIYATFGVFLILAARDPLAHLSEPARVQWRLNCLGPLRPSGTATTCS